METSKQEVENVLKKYVDAVYPEEVVAYNQKLEAIKQAKIQKVADKTFVNGTLMWQDTDANTTLLLNQLEAKNYCRELNLAKRKDWRVPTYEELLSLVDYTKANPASLEKIKKIAPSAYWSDTIKQIKQKQKEKVFWYVEYGLGKSDFTNEMEKKNIRCVRTLSTQKDNY